MATPAGKAVVAIFVLEVGALVSAEGPAQERMPNGPSAIFMDGIPSRSLGTLCIQSAPLSMATFSSSVMRPSRSSTRCSTARLGFLYGGRLEPLWFCATPHTVANRIKRKQRKRLTVRAAAISLPGMRVHLPRGTVGPDNSISTLTRSGVINPGDEQSRSVSRSHQNRREPLALPVPPRPSPASVQQTYRPPPSTPKA